MNYQELVTLIDENTDTQGHSMRLQDELNNIIEKPRHRNIQELWRVSHIFFNNTQKWKEFKTEVVDYIDGMESAS